MRLPRFTKSYHIKDYKFSLVILVLALSVIGILAVGSAKAVYQPRQIFGVAFGICVMFVVSLIDYVWVCDFYWLIYLFSVAILGAVIPFGEKVNGARRWIDLGITTFQPSELAKILLILFFAKFITEHLEEINDKLTLLKYAILCGIPLVLTALIFLSIVVQPDQKLLRDYQQQRILAFIEPEKYANDTAYQQRNAVMAIGSGQLTGKGLNNNTTTSVKNGNFIAEPQTDFIFAIIGEELGFVGSCIVIALLLLIVIQCILIGTRSQNLTGKIVCCGIGGLIGIQSFINIGVATQILPNTGVPLPFVSYGLTSLVSLYMGVGFVLNVGLQPKKYQ